jgi:hypothetical protein
MSMNVTSDPGSCKDSSLPPGKDWAEGRDQVCSEPLGHGRQGCGCSWMRSLNSNFSAWLGTVTRVILATWEAKIRKIVV